MVYYFFIVQSKGQYEMNNVNAFIVQSKG